MSASSRSTRRIRLPLADPKARGATDPIRLALDAVRGREDLRARRDADPVAFVHRFTDPRDQEIVALVAASLAFGNVKAIRAKLAELFERVKAVASTPRAAADRPKALFAALDGFKHRVFRGEDVARLMIGARIVQKTDGSLGRAFACALAAAEAHGAVAPVDASPPLPSDAFREALASFCDRIRVAGGLPLPGEAPPKSPRGPVSILSNARAGGAAKRLLLFLRWMIRPADGIDLGLWASDVPTSRLLVPVDVHIHKISRNLGFTRRNDVSWATAVEITDALARLDAADPIRYDFSLCHMGMLQRCPSRRDEARCEGCGVQPVCVHWKRRT